MRTKAKSGWIRAAAVLAGFAVFAIAWLVIELGADLFTSALWHAAMRHAFLHSTTNRPLVSGQSLTGSVVLWAYPACAGIVTVALLWQGGAAAWRRVAVQALLIALVGPMSWINYALSDQWLNVWIQSLFNLAMAIFFLTIVHGLRAIGSRAPDVMAVQTVGILMLTSFGVFLPLFYSCVFFGYASGMVTHEQIAKINDHIPLIFAGGAGSVVTFLAQLEKIRGGPAPGKRGGNARRRRSPSVRERSDAAK